MYIARCPRLATQVGKVKLVVGICLRFCLDQSIGTVAPDLTDLLAGVPLVLWIRTGGIGVFGHDSGCVGERTADVVTNLLADLSLIVETQFPTSVPQTGIIGLWSLRSKEIGEIQTRS